MSLGRLKIYLRHTGGSMKRIFQMLAVVIAMGALVQTISSAYSEAKSPNSVKSETKANGREGNEPGV